MKQRIFLAKNVIATFLALFLFSCNSGNEKKADEPAMEPTTAKPAETAPTPAPSPKLGNILIIQHKVANFTKWKVAYDSHDSIRHAHGLTNYILGRGTDNPNIVVIFLKMADVDKAKELVASPELKERMKKAGVLGMPTFTFLDVQMNDTSTIPQTARVMMNHKVKDFDAWKKEYDSHKQVRIDAGMIDRGLGYNIGDNHMVGIVEAVTDIKKAKAFLRSKDLKDKMAAAGVESPPTILFYNIVNKY